MGVHSPPRPDCDVHDDEQSPASGLVVRLWRRIRDYWNRPFALRDGRGRMKGLLVVVLVIFTLFGVRLIDIQVINGDARASEAKASRMMKVAIPAARGTIFDSTGVPLVQSVPGRDITVDPYLVDDPQAYAEALSPILGVPAEQIVPKFDRRTLADGTPIKFSYIARRVTMDVWEQVRGLRLPGVFSEPSSVRSYPGGPLAASLLGHTNIEGQGAAGLEAALNEELAGVDGWRVYERSASGGEIPTGSGSEANPTPGTSFTLTINRDLQWVAQQAVERSVKRFDADFAIVVVLEAKTGRLLALAQAPSSDPNDMTSRQAENFRNLAIEQAFEPGSIQKALTAAAVIEEGKADASTVFEVPNRLPRKNGNGEFQFKDDVNHPHYQMTLAGVLAQSSNVGTIQAAELIGPEKLREYLDRFGLGKPSGLGLPLENPGTLLPVSEWGDLTFPNVSYGQGLSVNAVNFAAAFGAIANDGVRMQPRLIDSKIYPDGSVEQMETVDGERVVSEETVRTLLPMMEQVVSDRGTASTNARIPGYRVGGKTGTAQRYDPEANGGRGGYNGYVASFFGLAPADDPELVVGVMTHNPKREYFGGVTGGPVFKEVMAAALQMMNIPPSKDPAPSLMLHTPQSTKGGPWNW